MAQTVAEISALPNGKTTLGIYSDNDIETFRDLVLCGSGAWLFLPDRPIRKTCP